MWLYIVGGVVGLLGAIYWYYFRDDGRFDEPEADIIIKPPWEYNLKPTQTGNSAAKKDNGGIPIKLLYYSQTGTAEDFSQRLSEDVRTYGFSPEVIDIEEYDAETLQDEKLVVFLVSTYGEGDPPDNAVQFHKWLLSDERDAGMLSNLKFAVFGLGNRTYDNFNAMGIQVNKRLEELGGKKFHVLGEGDDDVNIENDFLVWKKGFGTAICEEFSLPPPDKAAAVADVTRRQKLVIHATDSEKVKGMDVTNTSRWRHTDEAKAKIVDAKNPFMAKIISTKELHSQKSDRSCLHVEISTHNGLLTYQSGDHLGVYPENDLTLVHKLGALLGADLNQIISVHPIDDQSGRNAFVGPCTLKASLLQYYDITSTVKKAQLRVMAQYAQKEEDKNRLLKLSTDDPDEQELYDKWIVADNRSIIEVLKEFSEVKVPLDHFLEVLPKMQPRYYSISSSPLAQPDSVHITAVLVHYYTATKREVFGVTTNWLANHRPDTEEDICPRVPVFVRKSNFKLPHNLSTPVIMIGPGTGLAPFRGFIYERSHHRSKLSKDQDNMGETILFFGCRHPEHDYIYQNELESFKSTEILTDLVVAFSRAQEHKVYVQHKMLEKEMPKKIWKLLESGAHLYICGDARLMARDVTNALIEIIMKEGSKTKEEAEKYLSALQSNNRYMQDVWS